MAGPPGEVVDRLADVGRPAGVAVALVEPGHELAQLGGGRRQGDAVGEVDRAIAEGEELGGEEVGAAGDAEDEGRAAEDELGARRPVGGEIARQLGRTVVEPIVGELVAPSAPLGGEGARGGGDRGWQLRVEDVEVAGDPRVTPRRFSAEPPTATATASRARPRAAK